MVSKYHVANRLVPHSRRLDAEAATRCASPVDGLREAACGEFDLALGGLKETTYNRGWRGPQSLYSKPNCLGGEPNACAWGRTRIIWILQEEFRTKASYP